MALTAESRPRRSRATVCGADRPETQNLGPGGPEPPSLYPEPRKPLSTNIYTFSNLIEGGCLYVDKTRHIKQLLDQPNGQFFMARPRRFGKSLLVSTLKAIFEGRSDLFRGLYIDGTDYS